MAVQTRKNRQKF